MRGQFITGKMLVELAEAYTEALNGGGIPVIESAWEYMQSGELENAFRDTLKLHENEIQRQIVQKLPMGEVQIKQLNKEIKLKSFKYFQSNTLGDIKNSKNQSYLKKLKIDFSDKKLQAIKRNSNTIQMLSQ